MGDEELLLWYSRSLQQGGCYAASGFHEMPLQASMSSQPCRLAFAHSVSRLQLLPRAIITVRTPTVTLSCVHLTSPSIARLHALLCAQYLVAVSVTQAAEYHRTCENSYLHIPLPPALPSCRKRLRRHVTIHVKNAISQPGEFR